MNKLLSIKTTAMPNGVRITYKHGMRPPKRNPLTSNEIKHIIQQRQFKSMRDYMRSLTPAKVNY